MSKTIGVYKVTSNFSTEEVFKLLGASSQIEVCTRDYMSWCKKGKAPKTMQAEYDRAIRLPEINTTDAASPSNIFKVEILKAVDTLEALEAAKAEFGLGNKGGKPKTDKPKTPKADKPVLTPEDALAAMGTLTPAPAPEIIPEAVPEAAPVLEASPVPEASVDWEDIFHEYKAGAKVTAICERLAISKSTFYNKIKKFQ